MVIPGFGLGDFNLIICVHAYQACLRYTAAMGTADLLPCQLHWRHLVSEVKLLTCWSMSTNPERVKLCALPNLGDVSHWKSAWLSAPRRRLRCGHNKHKPAPFAPRSCSNGHPSRRTRSHLNLVSRATASASPKLYIHIRKRGAQLSVYKNSTIIAHINYKITQVQQTRYDGHNSESKRQSAQEKRACKLLQCRHRGGGHTNPCVP